MPGFLYYLPGGSAGVSLVEARAAGLGYVLDGPISTVGVKGGPDGGDGVLISLSESTPPERLRYEPASQRWRKMPGDSGAAIAWVGLYANQRLDPGSLARVEQLSGHFVRLLDDNEWLIPVARGLTDDNGELRWYHNVPRRSDLAEDGTWQPGPVVQRFAPLWSLAERWLRAEAAAAMDQAPGIAGSGTADTVKVTFNFSGLHESAIEVLAHNYRVGPVEVALLGLLSANISREILNALVDNPTLVAWVKKNRQADSAGSNTAAGFAAASSATVPPAPTSGPSVEASTTAN